MNQELYKAVLDYLNSNEVENKLQQILGIYFNEGQQNNFLKIWQRIKDLEFDINDLYYFLLFLTMDNFEKTRQIDDELFEQILIEVYDELQELYEEKKSNQELVISEQKLETTKTEQEGSRYNLEPTSGTFQELAKQYNNFISSSVFQNILVGQEQVGSRLNLEPASVKDNFYSAINAGDKIKTVAILRAICEKGKLGKSFKDDERYVEFFSAYLERHIDEKAKQEFLQNPSKPEYIIDFLQFILQKRLGFSEQESAMIGVGLAMLCNSTGEKEFASMAYGNEETGVFVWD